MSCAETQAGKGAYKKKCNQKCNQNREKSAGCAVGGCADGFVEGSGSGDGQILALALKLVAVDPGGVHVFAVADQHLELAVGEQAALNTDKGVSHLVEGDLRIDAIVALILFPALVQGTLIWDLKQGRIVVELDAGALEQLYLCGVGFTSFGAHVKGADGVLVFAGGFLVMGVDAAAKAYGVAFDVAIPQADELTGAQAGSDREAVCVNILVKDTLPEIQAGVHAEKGLERSGLQDLTLTNAGTLGNGEIIRGERGVVIVAAPLDKAGGRGPDRRERFAAQGLCAAFSLALFFETALLKGQVDALLQIALGELLDAQIPDDRKKIVVTILETLIVEGCAASNGDFFQPLGIQGRDLFAAVVDVVIKPGVGLGVGFALAGAAGRAAVEALSLAVFLHGDAPAVFFFDPDSGVCTLFHALHTSRYTGCASA